MKRLSARLLAVSLVLSMASLFVVPRVSASAYGESSYGTCGFQKRCPPKNTVTQTKAGLEVAINIVDGQQIPKGDYEIKVTPLNGGGRSFERVEFYIDGILVQTVFPDLTGTAAWRWDTVRYPGTRIKVLIYDTDGSVTEKQFSVRIVEDALPEAVTAAGRSEGEPAGGGPLGQFFAFLQAQVRALPAPVAVSIPFLLLAILLGIILLLFWQSRREAREVRRRMQAVERARQLAEEKDGFLELTSHYLRTPLTLIRGGTDFLHMLPSVGQVLATSITTAVDDFGSSIERLLDDMSNDPRLKNIPSIGDIQSLPGMWRAPLFWLPVLGIGAVLFLIDFVLIQAGKLDGPFLHITTHAALYTGLAIAFYNVLRRRQLYIRDKARMATQESQQAAIDEARNGLIRQASDTLAQKLENIRSYLTQVPDGQGKKFMAEGYYRIAEVLKRFRATATVVPPVTAMPFRHFNLASLISQAQQRVEQAASAKRVTITGGTHDIQMASPQPSWLVQILASILDNAIAYSPEGSQVEVGGQVKDGTAAVYVRDHGQGIARNKLAELFQPFSKAEGPMEFDHPGMGLSLYLDRLLIAGLGGSIQIESAPGSGATVQINFPVR